MATKIISTYVAAGYTLAAQYSALQITQRGGVGGAGVYCDSDAAITNAGKIDAAGADDGIRLVSGGSVVNGQRGLIEGYAGIVALGAASVVNHGTVEGAGRYGVDLKAGGAVVNGGGGAANREALIEGYGGVDVSGAGTVTNFGTISGAGGTAVRLGAAGDELVVEAGSVFLGAVIGGGGTLALASGVGTISNLGGGDVTVSGSMAATTFNDFGTLEIGEHALFTLTGVGAIGGGGIDTLEDDGVVVQTGTLTIGAGAADPAVLRIGASGVYTVEAGGDVASGASMDSVIRNDGTLIGYCGTGMAVVGVKIDDEGAIVAASGTLDLTQAITGSGALVIESGATLQARNAAASSLSMTFGGDGGTLALNFLYSARFAAVINGFTAGDTIDLLDKKATSATLGAGDVLTIANGSGDLATLQLAGNYVGDIFAVTSDGNGGTDVTVSVTDSPEAKLGASAAAGHRLVAAMAAFGAGTGGGAVHTADPWSVHEPMLARPSATSASGLSWRAGAA